MQNSIRDTIKGTFMLFRILPVLVWSFTGTLVGTSMAVGDGHEVNWTAFVLVLMIAALVQGYPTHIVNEIFDWKSGADGRDLRTEKSGGSKVLQARLLSQRGLWVLFTASHVVIIILVLMVARVTNPAMILYFIVPGYLSGLLYSLPPFRFCYRPFLGEWLGGFAGMFFLILGSFYAQTLTVSPLALLIASGVGLIYIGIMTFFHYLDFKYDSAASPKKNTTVVYLGLIKCRRYAYVCLVPAIVILFWSAFRFQITLLPLSLLGVAVLIGHQRADLQDAISIIRWGKVITYSAVLVGLASALLAKPIFLVMVLPVTVSFWAHKKFGKLSRVRISD